MSSTAATTYTCPMHPQIRQPGPGDCPICGMALEPLRFHGASSQRLAEATRVLELEADHMAAWFSNSLQERRGDMLNLAENVTLARQLSSPSASDELQRSVERIHDRLQRAYPDRYHTLYILAPQDGRIIATRRRSN